MAEAAKSVSKFVTGAQDVTRSPLGFGPILLFYICVLASGVMLQNLAAAHDVFSRSRCSLPCSSTSGFSKP